MINFEFKQEVKCNCGCNRTLGIVLGKSNRPGMWIVSNSGKFLIIDDNRNIVVGEAIKHTGEEKVKIPKEIADILDQKAYASGPDAMHQLLDKNAHKLFKTDWAYRKGNLIKLARAIEDGYEVEAPTFEKGDYVVFESADVKWIAKCNGVEEELICFEYAIEFKLGRYDCDKEGKMPKYFFNPRIATEAEVKEYQRAAAFVKNNRIFNLFMPYDIATDTEGQIVRVEKGTDKSGNVVVLYGNEEDGYLTVVKAAAELTLRYMVEDRVDL
ncbi:hypothetical protein [Bacillus wiedmannii]|uniref:hypothetical protein n=1 Tax=Bacillus wiedmannii TaxID=1890302 RepID=UPI000B4390D4|nr:hypothetical protein BK740_07350 [Bacillus thuringiensis serovar argentinensis]